MAAKQMSFRTAMDEVSASSAGGMPFLACYGVSFLLVGVLSFAVSRDVGAILSIFQGVVALPVALLVERRCRWNVLSRDNPLRQFSILLAVSQALAIPFLVVIYNVNPGQIPVCLAGLAGVHLLPYGWLHRTNVYIALAVFVSLSSFALVIVLQADSFGPVLLVVGITYLMAAPLVYRNARNLVAGPSVNPDDGSRESGSR